MKMILNKKGTAGFFFMAFSLWLLMAFSSCKSTKKIQAAILKKDTASVHITDQAALDSVMVIKNVLGSIHSRRADFKTFSAKIKAEYEDSKGKQPNITAYVRVFKDSLIWISGYATVFNIEAFRVLIRKDSVFVLDKINKEIQKRSIDYLQEVTQIPFDFTTLQDLLVGNPVFSATVLFLIKRQNQRSYWQQLVIHLSICLH